MTIKFGPARAAHVQETRIRLPIAATAKAIAAIGDRLGQVLDAFKRAVKASAGTSDRVTFTFDDLRFFMICGPDDNGDPCLTLVLPDKERP